MKIYKTPIKADTEFTSVEDAIDALEEMKNEVHNLKGSAIIDRLCGGLAGAVIMGLVSIVGQKRMNGVVDNEPVKRSASLGFIIGALVTKYRGVKNYNKTELLNLIDDSIKGLKKLESRL
jgi:butyrate kinase